LRHDWDGIFHNGGWGQRSFAAETVKIAALNNPITPKAIPVLRFQCFGLAHQPPDGVHTCNQLLLL
jgi:hypothetical protein